MDKYHETLNTWNKIASIYEEKFMDLDIYNDTYNTLCSSDIKQNAKVLEIGCGPGNITRFLLKKRPDFKILGIDSAPNMIEIAKRNNPSAQFMQFDARNIELLNDKFDLIVSGFCLPYLSDEERMEFIYQSGKLLEDNGRIYLSFVEGNSANSTYKESHVGRVFFQYHELDQVVQNLKKSNFTDISIKRVRYTKETDSEEHTVIIAKKTPYNSGLAQAGLRE